MNAAVIVAAGAGLRMGSSTRKQYLELEGLPVLSHTLRVFNACTVIHHIYLVVPEGENAFCRNTILPPVELHKPITLVPGGTMRQDSVWNGITSIREADSDCVVAIHDGVRPFVTVEQLTECIEAARLEGACILGIPATDTLKSVSVDGRILSTVDRKRIWMAQTPQVFRYELILKAHAAAREEKISGTDDAELVEKTMGVSVRILAGSRNNIKITTPEDMPLARLIMSSRRM